MRLIDILSILASITLASAQITVKSSIAGGNEVFDGYVSFSIEFSSFPDYAGNSSHPNKFSDTLLENIGNIIGTRPYIRVGGNTQDFALYDASQSEGLIGIYSASEPDYPTTITIGDAFFESYGTWDGVQFSHGFNMALGGSTVKGWQTLISTVPLACKALGGGKLYTWEYGNEPDLYSPSVRPDDWDNTDYIDQWKNATSQIKDLVNQHCGGLSTKFMAPSFAGVGNELTASTCVDGIDSNGDLEYFSTHNYISGADSPGVTLQGTLMNHEVTTASVDAHITEYSSIKSSISSAPPMIYGETNSLYNQGAPGLSNTFGAALWGVDFNLYSASVGFKRTHMHQGSDYRYASWQPVNTKNTTMGTKAPYYGNIAVAAMLGNLADKPAAIAEVSLGGDNQESAYAAYVDSGKSLERVLIINMVAYNSTKGGTGEVALDPSELETRGSRKYALAVDGVSSGTPVLLQRLMANGSDAISGITWDGYSYNYEEDSGKPVRLKNITVGETTKAGNGGVVNVEVPDSSAVILTFGTKNESPQSVQPDNHGESGSGAAKASEPKKSGAGRGMNIMGWQL